MGVLKTASLDFSVAQLELLSMFLPKIETEMNLEFSVQGKLGKNNMNLDKTSKKKEKKKKTWEWQIVCHL